MNTMMDKYESDLQYILESNFNMYADCFMVWWDMEPYTPFSFQLRFNCYFDKFLDRDWKHIAGQKIYNEYQLNHLDEWCFSRKHEFIIDIVKSIQELLDAVEVNHPELMGYRFDREYTKTVNDLSRGAFKSKK